VYSIVTAILWVYTSHVSLQSMAVLAATDVGRVALKQRRSRGCHKEIIVKFDRLCLQSFSVEPQPSCVFHCGAAYHSNSYVCQWISTNTTGLTLTLTLSPPPQVPYLKQPRRVARTAGRFEFSEVRSTLSCCRFSSPIRRVWSCSDMVGAVFVTTFYVNDEACVVTCG
jgi:hypothetical protein